MIRLVVWLIAAMFLWITIDATLEVLQIAHRMRVW